MTLLLANGILGSCGFVWADPFYMNLLLGALVTVTLSCEMIWREAYDPVAKQQNVTVAALAGIYGVCALTNGILLLRGDVRLIEAGRLTNEAALGLLYVVLLWIPAVYFLKWWRDKRRERKRAPEDPYGIF
jgi:hypothetical protein